MPSGASGKGPLDAGDASCWSAQGRASELVPGSRPCSMAGSSAATPLPDVDLCPAQSEVLKRVVAGLNLQSSVVITNPLKKDNPIVYVTKPWENMCGFTSSEAIGRNPRLTQGEHSDPAVIQLVSSALQQQRSCKVMMLNYRSGAADAPFWNMLSISPVMHQGSLVFYLANLQDYTYHMTKLVSLPPSQFCRSAEHHQLTRKLPEASARDNPREANWARPGIFEADDTCVINAPKPSHPNAQLHMRRLGWARLNLEPEHLADRLSDCLQLMDAKYERVEASDEAHDDVFCVNAEISGVAARFMVSRDPNDEVSWRIACTRLGGDTFAYHNAFRQLRELLGDAVSQGAPLMGKGDAKPRPAAAASFRGHARPAPSDGDMMPPPPGKAARTSVAATASSSAAAAAAAFSAGASSLAAASSDAPGPSSS